MGKEFVVGRRMDPVGEEDKHQTRFRIRPEHSARKTSVSITALRDLHRGVTVGDRFEERFIDTHAAAVSLTSKIAMIESTHRFGGEESMTIVIAIVEKHDEKLSQIASSGEKTRVTSDAAHNGGILVVDLAMDKAMAEKIVLFGRSDTVLINTMLEGIEASGPHA